MNLCAMLHRVLMTLVIATTLPATRYNTLRMSELEVSRMIGEYSSSSNLGKTISEPQTGILFTRLKLKVNGLKNTQQR